MKNDDKTPATRFDVGTTVEVKLGVADWVRGTVLNTNITHKSLPAEWRAPYEVEISDADEDATRIFVPRDTPTVIRTAQPTAPPPPKPSRECLVYLLQEWTNGGGEDSYCCGEEWAGAVLPQIKLLKRDSEDALKFPLDDGQAADFVAAAKRSGVGTMTETVVNLEARKSWELLPADLDFVNVREWETEVMNPMLKTISDKLGLDGWKIGASLYKMLLYEPGCFFRRARVVLSHCVRMVPASMSTHLFCRALSCGAPRAGHKDNVRIDNMWGTLVIQLPSEYTGASLSVYSPSTPNEHTVFAFGGGVETGSSSTTRRSTRQQQSSPLEYACFYADCQHEVDTLVSGRRCVLVYNLTGVPATDKMIKKRGLNDSEWRAAPFKLCSNPPQPASEEHIAKIAHQLHRFITETDAAYPNEYDVTVDRYRYRGDNVYEQWSMSLPRGDSFSSFFAARGTGISHDDWMLQRVAKFSTLSAEIQMSFVDKVAAAQLRYNSIKHGKPSKLVLILSHFYTPQVLQGLHSLKGRDRVVAEQLVAALRCTRDASTVQNLSALAAQTLVQDDPPDYHELDKDSAAMGVLNDVLQMPDGTPAPAGASEGGGTRVSDGAPPVDAFLSLVVLWDSGECSPQNTAFTFGPLIPLVPGTTVPPELKAAVGLPLKHDERGLRKLFNGDGICWDDEDVYPEDSDDPEFLERAANNWWDIGEVHADKRSLPIYTDEVLLSNDKLREEIHSYGGNDSFQVPDGNPNEAEFLGNGCPYPGQCYSRAAILLWPKKDRSDIIGQSMAGAAMQAKAAAAASK